MGFPDVATGRTIEAGGKVCAATIGQDANGITIFDPDGATEHLGCPDPITTNICFGGPDMQTLFVTTASHGLDAGSLARHPDAGRLLMLRVSVAGVPVLRFADR